MLMSFGKNLEKLRKDNKVSQARLGEVLGITQQMVSNYEKESSQPNIELLVKMADFFKVSIDAFVGYSPVNSEEMVTQRERLLNYYDRLTEADRDKCFTIMQTIISMK